MAHRLIYEKKYTATIDRISQLGNGIIEMGGWYLNLGEMAESKEGKVVTFRYEGGRKCHFLQVGKQNEATPLSDDYKFKSNRSSGSSKDVDHEKSPRSSKDVDYEQSSSSSNRVTTSNNPIRKGAGSKNDLLNGSQ